MNNTLKIDFRNLNIVMPLGLCIGVTGHRKNLNKKLINEKIREVLKTLNILLDTKLIKTPHYFVIISPLAEGADSLVASEVLNWENSRDNIKNRLEVILPLPETEYIEDFETDDSKNEFYRLLKLSNSIKTFKNCKSHEEAYERVGHYIINHCDVLIAIWDGKPALGKGGTAEIIDYARRKDKPIFWINSITGEITSNSLNKLDNLFKYIESYNNETLNDSKIKNKLQYYYNFLEEKLNDSEISSTLLDPLSKNLLLNFTRADLLANKYQSIYMNVDTAIYVLGALAVIIFSVQKAFLKQIPQLLWFQVAVISTIIILLKLSEKKEFHRRWLDYRFLSENLRSSIFFSILGIKSKINDPMPYSIPIHYNNWVIRTCDWICNRQLEMKPDINIPLEKLKNFLLNAWIYDQINFYNEKSAKYRNRHQIVSLFGYIFFAITFMVAIVYAVSSALFNIQNPTIFNSLELIGSITVFSGVITAISIHREYLRNSKRYQNMIPNLFMINNKIMKTDDIDELIEILEEANKIMLAEHHDWRAIISFHDVELP